MGGGIHGQVGVGEEDQLDKRHPPEEADLEGGEGQDVSLGRLDETLAQPEPRIGATAKYWKKIPSVRAAR